MKIKRIWTFGAIFILVNFKQILLSNSFNLTLIHMNDFHGNILPIDSKGEPCSTSAGYNRCYGGLSRIKYKIEELQKSHDNPVVLNIGDTVQGTIWQTLLGWKAFIHFLNKINFTAMAIGSHDFDQGPGELMNFLMKLNYPTICSNINAREMPEFQNAYKNSITLNIQGRKIGLIGYISKGSFSTSTTTPLKFYDELETIKLEAERLHNEQVNIIIAIGHSGYPVDLEIAKIPNIDIVVGGKSHTFLYSGTVPSTDESKGAYPTVVRKRDNSSALVVQAGSYGKYLGFLKGQFDTDGNLKSWNGNPIFMDSTTASDDDLSREIDSWYSNLEKTLKEIVGSTRVMLDGRSSSCRVQECNIGNILTDSFVYSMLLGLKNLTGDQWNSASIGIASGGSIQTSLDELSIETPVTLQNVYKILPYKNKLTVIELLGETLKDILEFGASQLNHSSSIELLDGRFLQVSGLRMTIDVCQPIGQRISQLLVLCNECRIPKYSILDTSSVYRVVLTDFFLAYQISNDIVSEEYGIINQVATGILDTEALVNYLKARGPLITGTERRIVVNGLNGCQKNIGYSVIHTIEPTTNLLMIFSVVSYTN